MKISIHQINTITGDLNGNTDKIIQCLDSISDDSIDITVFPETAISGYMCGSLWDNIEFIKDQMECINKIHHHFIQMKYGHKIMGTKPQVLIFGAVRMIGMKRNGFPKLRNAVVCIDNQGIQYYDKQYLADADHHEDKKYFEPGTESKIFKVYIRGQLTKIGVPVCEDSWIDDHNRNIPNEMVQLGAELLIIPNQSYTYYGKQEKRKKLFSKIAFENNVPIVSVNSVGVGDILKNIVIFDGGSMVFNKDGNLITELPRFKEFNKVIDLNNYSILDAQSSSKYKEIVDILVYEQYEFFRLNGIKKAQVHVSGGLDSAIVASLCTLAMGKENVILITNPSSLNTKSLNYVEQLCDALEIGYYINPIQEIYDKMVSVDDLSFGSEPSLNAKTCMQAVLRTVQGLAASHRFGSGIVATGNHTEIVLGWANFHDIGSIGVHSLIGDLTKMELYALAEYLNDIVFKKEVIPYDLYTGKFVPAAELPNANEDPIDYTIQSGICASLIRERKTKKSLLNEFKLRTLNSDYFNALVYACDLDKFEEEIDFAIKSMKRSIYKAAQAAPIVVISPRSRGFSNRETLVNYY